MNYLQFFAFIIYLGSLWVAGNAVYSFLNPRCRYGLNRFVYLGECFLLGAILVIGELFLLSFFHLYYWYFLWAVVIAQFVFLFVPSVRQKCVRTFSHSITWDFPLVIFLSLLVIFIFRNLFFLVDVDSHNVYLYAQKLWLEQGISLWGNRGVNICVFSPHFNAVPYALGISLFGTDTLFPQLVVVSWSIIVSVLVFGYTSWRFNRWYGLAATMMFLFNDHIFYSGANNCVIINSALIAFFFAAAYNFWQSRIEKDGFRFTLALIFLFHVMANKYQAAAAFVFLFIMGLFIQPSLWLQIRSFFSNRRYVLAMMLGAGFVGLWYLKNIIISGCPTFPVMAGKFNAFGWTTVRDFAFMQACGHPSLTTLLKYASFLFVWPGVDALKWLFLILFFLPGIMLVLFLRHKEVPVSSLGEWFYWFNTAFFITVGIFMVAFADVRAYRYSIALAVFAVIFSYDFILRQVFSVRHYFLLKIVILFLCLLRVGIIFDQGGTYAGPTFRDNWGVISNRLHFQDIVGRYYPKNLVVMQQLPSYVNRRNAAWDTGQAMNSRIGSAFLLPTYPELDFWYTSIVNWDSYGNRSLILKDLSDFGLKYFMYFENDKLRVDLIDNYVKRALSFSRNPQEILINYGFPEELWRVRH